METSKPSFSLPMAPLNTRNNGGKAEVWDSIRRKWLVLTPEEHVRQCLVAYLVEVIEVPKCLISLERGLKYNNLPKRFDILVFDREGQPFILCECKAPNVDLTDETLFQWSVYHKELQSQVLFLTNGKRLFAAARDGEGKWKPLLLPETKDADGWRMHDPEWKFVE